jgi:hypothetical protein
MEQMPCGQFEANALWFCYWGAGLAADLGSHGDGGGGDAALEAVSVGGQAGAPRARLDAAD